MIPGGEEDVLHAFGIDLGAVAAAQVHELVAAGRQAQLGMAARDFGVVQPNRVTDIAADADKGFSQFEALAFIRPAYDEQSEHGESIQSEPRTSVCGGSY